MRKAPFWGQGWCVLGALGMMLLAPVAFGSGGSAVAVESLTVLALSAAEGRAVVQLPDGSQRALAVGQEIPEAGVALRKVFPDRIEVAEKQDRPGKIRRRIWIFLAADGKTSRVQVLDRERPEPVPVVRPRSGR